MGNGLSIVSLLNQWGEGFGDDLTEENDPHGEHDFGAFEHKGIRYFWKIDYYDLAMHMHSPNPADPKVTHRMLTVMSR